MKILRIDTLSDNDRVLKYKLTSSPTVQKMSTLDDQRIDVAHYAIYVDEKADRNGEIKETTVLSVMTRQGELFATNSNTVIEEFLKLIDVFGADLETDGGYIPVRVFSGISKNDRKFFTCTYAD